MIKTLQKIDNYNVIANSDPKIQKETLRYVLDSGNLSTLPNDITNLKIITEGSGPTRKFHIGFSIPEHSLNKWFQDSKGFKNAEIRYHDKTIIEYSLIVDGRTGCFFVDISHKYNKVEINYSYN